MGLPVVQCIDTGSSRNKLGYSDSIASKAIAVVEQRKMKVMHGREYNFVCFGHENRFNVWPRTQRGTAFLNAQSVNERGPEIAVDGVRRDDGHAVEFIVQRITGARV
ncbi:hypothetical protein D3C78_1511780 [compost metagenome]